MGLILGEESVSIGLRESVGSHRVALRRFLRKVRIARQCFDSFGTAPVAPFAYGKLNVTVRKTAIWARVTELPGQ
jgi:hypothetical protein